jgi:streptogramin lyase
VKLSPIGKVLAIWKQPMDVPPFGITVDTQGNIYVAVKSIKKLSSSGAVLATWRATCP